MHLSIILLGIFINEVFSFSHPPEVLPNKSVFTFQNVHNGGFLTAINLKTPYPPVIVDRWRGAPTQKWRAVSAYFSNAYQLKPTSDEAFILQLDTHTKMVTQDFAGLGLENSQYWKVRYVGNGLCQLVNYKTNECLKSMGYAIKYYKPGRQVGVSRCNNSKRQQWDIHIL